jgi:type I pantothenate kinase
MGKADAPPLDPIQPEVPLDATVLLRKPVRPSTPAVTPASLIPLFTKVDRAAWAGLGTGLPSGISQEALSDVCGMDDVIDLAEVTEVYGPICSRLGPCRSSRPRGPFIIGIGGSVAAGKSTTARLLQTLLSHCCPNRQVALVTTDGFLLENQELERRGLMHRKGFPESYDTAALFHFLASARAGVDILEAPVYSHLRYDVVPGEVQHLSNPDVLIVEGLSVLRAPAPGEPRPHAYISDFFDFSFYVHAHEDDLARWFTERFLALRATAFQQPESYFRRYAHLSDQDASQTAAELWRRINAPNLAQNIAPSMAGARVILHKASDHHVQSIWVKTAHSSGPAFPEFTSQFWDNIK